MGSWCCGFVSLFTGNPRMHETMNREFAWEGNVVLVALSICVHLGRQIWIFYATAHV